MPDPGRGLSESDESGMMAYDDAQQAGGAPGVTPATDALIAALRAELDEDTGTLAQLLARIDAERERADKAVEDYHVKQEVIEDCHKRIAELERVLRLYRDDCHVCGVESCRHRGADHEFQTTEDRIAELEAEVARLRAYNKLADETSAGLLEDVRRLRVERDAEMDQCLLRIQERDEIMRTVLGDACPVKERTTENAMAEVARLHERLAAAEREVEEEIQRRDRYHDAITQTHVALGGDGEWRAHVGGAPKPPHSGHLHLDLPVMAANLRSLIADCLALNPVVTGDMEKVRVWTDVVRRMQAVARGEVDGG